MKSVCEPGTVEAFENVKVNKQTKGNPLEATHLSQIKNKGEVQPLGTCGMVVTDERKQDCKDPITLQQEYINGRRQHTLR